ncbi:serine/threonine kinase NLK-like [Anastrepha obliqua]|uniref:serine/threonine kinase NLK-like n=1 Tax=Anastrepha obliqua TaxID=95512 RepID=UPI00240A45C1|nr:serine/threonine kinase NLK-like [Anastrepha obliqua]
MAAIVGPKRQTVNGIRVNPNPNHSYNHISGRVHSRTGGISANNISRYNISSSASASTSSKQFSHTAVVPVAAPTSRPRSHISMSVSMSLVQGGAAGGAPQGAILAAAAPYYQPPAVPQDVQPDRPIGYGAFGVVW